jgi:hypothetical protein
MIDMGSFLASHKSKIFLAMRGTPPLPLQTPKTEGAHPPSGNPLKYLFDGGGAEKKCLLFLATFLKQIEHFFTISGLKKRGGSKVRCFAYI